MIKALVLLKAVTRGGLWEKVFLEFSQNLHENTCVRVSFLIKLQAYSFPAQILMSKANDRSLPAWRPATLLKRMQHRCFPVKYAKFWRTSANDRFCTAKGCARRKPISESIKNFRKGTLHTGLELYSIYLFFLIYYLFIHLFILFFIIYLFISYNLEQIIKIKVNQIQFSRE